jgi:LacI family transcriptional regulator
MEKLTDYLYSLGPRKLGFVGHHATLRPIHERANVVLESAARYPDVQVPTAADIDSLEGGRRATRTLLSADPGLTAIVCVNDLMAVGAMREIRDRGLRIPEDISVTGFDNIKLAQFCYPALTTVHIPRDQIGQNICDALITNEKTKHAQEIIIDPELVLRDSTGPARGRERIVIAKAKDFTREDAMQGPPLHVLDPFSGHYTANQRTS